MLLAPPAQVEPAPVQAAPAPVVAPAAIRSVRFLPEVWGEPARRARVLCQDGALPTPVPGGTLWTFGDTFLGTRAADGTPSFSGALSNSMALVPAGATGWPVRLEYVTGPDGTPAAPLSLHASEDPKTRRLWPLAGVWLEPAGTAAQGGDAPGATGRAYMFYGIIDVVGPGPWGFAPRGTGLARAPAPLGPYERLEPPRDGPRGWPIDASSIVRHEGWLYLYAPRRFKGEHDLSSGLLVARVRDADIEDPAKYEFFAGVQGPGAADTARWAARVEDAAPAADDVWGQASVAWNRHLRAYVLTSAANLFKHDEIRLRTAPTPWGPWVPLAGGESAVKVPERPGERTQLIYCAMYHPELDEQDGRVLTITFCRMLRREWALTNPEAVRIELGPPR